MSTEKLRTLIDKYLDESIQPEEQQQLADMLQHPRYGKEFKDIVSGQLSDRILEIEPDESVGSSIRSFVLARIKDPNQHEPASLEAPYKHRMHLLRTTWFRYAAAVLLAVALGGYIWLNQLGKSSRVVQPTPEIVQDDVAPGRDGAILTLADGSKMELDSVEGGLIAEQNGTQLVLQNGQLAYNTTGDAIGKLAFNAVSTPKGRQFKLILPDGTQAWLNAASSIHYPIFFTGKERKVSITGEVFFDVAKNKQMPFIVQINDETSIRVLGTIFNVNAFENEANITTTLLEGAVSIFAFGVEKKLAPAQQALITPQKKLVIEDQADVDKAIAWKNGYFNFNDSNLEEVMRQLERWYNIEVVYQKKPQQVAFHGKLQRNLSLIQVLEILEEMKIKFVLKGRTLTIE